RTLDRAIVSPEMNRPPRHVVAAAAIWKTDRHIRRLVLRLPWQPHRYTAAVGALDSDGLDLNVACVTDTAVPPGPLTISTTASSCRVKALTRLVPGPGLVTLALTSGLPLPLSLTASFQSGPATL